MKAEITLEYKGKTYTVHDEYEWDSFPPYIWEEGNYACDCNKALFIQRQIDEDFPDLPCGKEIKTIEIKRIK